MQKAPAHPHESARLTALKTKGLQNVTSDSRFDAITSAAVSALKVATSHVALIKETEEIYLSCSGTQTRCGARDISFCGHALLSEDVLVIEDTLKDERFSDNPYVLGEPFVRFYAGMRLLDRHSGLPLGVFCVKDTKPRKFSLDELGIFLSLAAQAEAVLQ